MKRSMAWLAIVIIAVAGLLGGCGSKPRHETAGSSLKYWMLVDARMKTVADNFGQTQLAQQLEKETGVKVEYIHPRELNNAFQELTLLKMAGSYPDIVEFGWYTVPGGPESAIREGYILPLNEIIARNAPNLKAFLQQNAEIDKMVRTDTGNYYVFPFIRGAEELCYPSGLMLRGDWLEQCNLEVPETINEWYAVLTAFRQRYGCAAPLTLHLDALVSGAFVGAWGETMDYYQVDGQPVYGPARAGYKAFLEEMAKWYAEGLIDPFFGATGREGVEINMLSERSGATFGTAGGNMGKWVAAGKDGFDLVPAVYPSLVPGRQSSFGRKDWSYYAYGAAAITPVCRNVEAAAAFLDYGYSKEGMLLYNFGVQNESYEMVGGVPRYTKLITENSNGYDMGTAMFSYVRAQSYGPFIQMKEYLNQYYSLSGQRSAPGIWSQTEVERYRMPMVTFSKEESVQISGSIAQISQIATEMTVDIITGVQPPEQFEVYVQRMQEAGLEQVLETYRAALKRYQGR